ncbi:MAG: FAD-dependent monooxygenase [Caulobacterales bacterium]
MADAQTTTTHDHEVLIAGAGPVGLTLALQLAQYGISVRVFERNSAPLKWPKMERCNARTMEIFRRMGIAEKIRSASRFRDVPMDVFVVTRLQSPPLLHLRYPSVTEAQRLIAASRDGAMPREPYQLISQYTLEPLLKAEAEKLALIQLSYGCAVDSFEQDGQGVTVRTLTSDGRKESVRGSFLVGCDGGSSATRKALGIRFEGQGQILALRQILFRSRSLFEAIPVGKGRHYYFPDTTLVVQDDLEHFAFHTARVTQQSAETVVRDLLELDIDVEVQNDTVWNQNLLLAERYRVGRVFIAGDAAHIVIPNGGLGLNTGIGDATDLSWKLAAVAQGWGGARLLASYEAERRPIAVRNREASGRSARGVLAYRTLIAAGPDLDSSDPAAVAYRRVVEASVLAGQKHSQGLDGVELGYVYCGSPIICEEPGTAPPPDDVVYTPSTAPGARLPHMWLSSGEAVGDVLGVGFSLIILGSSIADGEAFAAAFKEAGASLSVHHFDDASLLKLYERRLLLIRPDLHVAWRGDRVPDDLKSLVARITGQD